jgi:hypothetical protein
MTDWRAQRKADPLPWLLEPDDANPGVRYLALRDLLDRSTDDPEVVAAYAQMMCTGPIPALLGAQHSDGYWIKRDYYLPRHRGTLWTLTFLSDLGLTADEEHVRRGCEYMFTFQRDDGSFCRRRRISGQGVVWQEHPEPCTHARTVRFLIQFGYSDDARVRKAIDWLMATQRDDGMWFCGSVERRGCIRATLDVLRVAVLDPSIATHAGIAGAATAVCDLLMEPRMSRYHVGPTWGTWENLDYPHFGIGVIPALDALARLGYTPEKPNVAAAVEYLLSRQLPNGSWPQDQSAYRPPFAVGSPCQPSKWVTLDALRVLKLLYGRD